MTTLRAQLLIAATLISLSFVGLGACASPDADSANPTPAQPVDAAPVPTEPRVVDVPPTLDFELAMKNPGTPLDRVLTGGQPTLADLDTLAAYGYQTVVNLRTEGESGQEGEAEHVRSLGMDYVQLPIAGADDLTQKNALALIQVIGDLDRQPVLVHCASSNRVGALLALAAFFVDGNDPDSAVALGKTAGLGSLESAVREQMAAAPTDQ